MGLHAWQTQAKAGLFQVIPGQTGLVAVALEGAIGGLEIVIVIEGARADPVEHVLHASVAVFGASQKCGRAVSRVGLPPAASSASLTSLAFAYVEARFSSSAEAILRQLRLPLSVKVYSTIQSRR